MAAERGLGRMIDISKEEFKADLVIWCGRQTESYRRSLERISMRASITAWEVRSKNYPINLLPILSIIEILFVFLHILCLCVQAIADLRYGAGMQ